MTTAMPEWLSRKDRETGSWQVDAGLPQRGDAWTINLERRMRVPMGDDSASRTIRAHEMMHARVSPERMAATPTASLDSIIAAEEYRVNLLIGIAGFDLTSLADGSEETWGKRYGEQNLWNNAVHAIAAMADTQGSKLFLKGVKAVNPQMAESLRAVEKIIIKEWTAIAKRFVATNKRGPKKLTPEAINVAAKFVGSTQKTFDGILPDGYVYFTLKLAAVIESFLTNDDDEPGEIPSAQEITEVTNGKAGKFARLVLHDNLPLVRSVDGRLGRRRIATNMGRTPRRIDRMLTDPQRRIFDHRIRGKGGVIVIDQSGSMSLSEEQLWKIIEAAPGCTIIGYSHRIKSADTPNVWVIAERGKVCEQVPRGNGGNGVDGPALRFAASKRRTGEAFIWVCDGAVTDGNDDHYYPNLGEECARLVLKHGIHMVYNVDEAIKALTSAQHKILPPSVVGELRFTSAWTNHKNRLREDEG